MSYTNLLLNVLYHIVMEMKILESCLQTGLSFTNRESRLQNRTFIYKVGVLVYKWDSRVTIYQNPFEGSLKRNKNGNLLSTKDDFNKHGYGISSIKNVVGRYGGNVFIDEENGKFVITISMNIPEI